MARDPAGEADGAAGRDVSAPARDGTDSGPWTGHGAPRAARG